MKEDRLTSQSAVSQIQWLLSGALDGYRRFSRGESVDSDYYGQLAKTISDESGPAVTELLFRLDDLRSKMPEAERVRYFGDTLPGSIEVERALSAGLKLRQFAAKAETESQQKAGTKEDADEASSTSTGDTPPAADESTETPAVTPGDPKPDAAPEPKPDVGNGNVELVCCKYIEVFVNRIKVIDDTDGLGKDDVAITGLSSGTVMPVSPLRVAWPLDNDKKPDERKMKTSGEEPVNLKVLRVTPGQRCEFAFETQIQAWEVDDNELDELLRRAADELSAQLLQGTGITAVSSKTVGSFLDLILDRLIDELKLKDDLMLDLPFGISGRMTPDIALKDYDWSPPFGQIAGATMSAPNDNQVNIIVRNQNDGGEWEMDVRVYRRCGS